MASVNRRNLTRGQRAAIVLEFEELVKQVRVEARERQRKAAEETNAKLGRGLKDTVDPDSDQATPKGRTYEILAEKAGIGKSLDPVEGFPQGRTRDILGEKAAEETNAKLGRGSDATVFPDLEKATSRYTHVELAEKAGIGKSSMASLQAVQRKQPDLFAKVKAGEITINKAYTEMKKREKAAATALTTKRTTKRRRQKDVKFQLKREQAGMRKETAGVEMDGAGTPR